MKQPSKGCEKARHMRHWADNQRGGYATTPDGFDRTDAFTLASLIDEWFRHLAERAYSPRTVEARNGIVPVRAGEKPVSEKFEYRLEMPLASLAYFKPVPCHDLFSSAVASRRGFRIKPVENGRHYRSLTVKSPQCRRKSLRLIRRCCLNR